MDKLVVPHQIFIQYSNTSLLHYSPGLNDLPILVVRKDQIFKGLIVIPYFIDFKPGGS